MTSDSNPLEQTSTPPKAATSAFSSFQTQFENEAHAEKKLRLGLDFMRDAISQNTPRFRDFWEAKKLCLPLFKENLSAPVRASLWNEYTELSNEARRVKEILDEQSSFAVEQIELAIVALEKEVADFDALLGTLAPIDFPESHTLQNKENFYQSRQKELDLLNTQASRINSLRKEIIKTEMRIRYKNRFFERLSRMGDVVFPKRKELVKQISEEFVKDVDHFIQAHFQEEERSHVPLFALREEIKALQALGKILTLNTHAFTETRMRLSSCWDKIREKEKERKQDFLAKQQTFKENYDQVNEKIQQLKASLDDGALDPEGFMQQLDDLEKSMRNIELGREEVRSLKEAIRLAKEPLIEKERKEEAERQEKRKEEELQRKEKLEKIKQSLMQLIQDADALENEKLIEAKDELFKEFEQTRANKLEKAALERLFKQMKEKIEEKREKALLNLSADDMQALEQLKELLEEKKEERQVIKLQLETYRKALGGSALSVEKAMQVQDLVEEEKARLDKINISIEEIEEKISDSFL